MSLCRFFASCSGSAPVAATGRSRRYRLGMQEEHVDLVDTGTPEDAAASAWEWVRGGVKLTWPRKDRGNARQKEE